MCFNYYHTLEPLLLSLLALLFQLGRAKFSRCPFCPYCSSGWVRPIFLGPMRLSSRAGSLYWLCALQQAHGYRTDAGKGQPASHQCKAGCEVMPPWGIQNSAFWYFWPVRCGPQGGANKPGTSCQLYCTFCIAGRLWFLRVDSPWCSRQ